MSKVIPSGRLVVVKRREVGDLVVVLATWTSKKRWSSLEHKFLAEIVHARLAKSVKWLHCAASIFKVKHESSRVWLGKLVFVALRGSCLKFSYFIAHVAHQVFCRAFRLGARRQFLLEAKANVLDIDQYPCKTLLNLGDLVIVPIGDSRFCEVDCCADARKCGHDVHKCSPGVEKGGVRAPDSTFGGDIPGEGV